MHKIKLGIFYTHYQPPSLDPAKLTPSPSLKNDCVNAYDPKKERGAVWHFYYNRKVNSVAIEKSYHPSL
jgi:hypothetical protein